MTYEEIIRSAVERGLIEDARGRSAGWLRQRLAQHCNPTEPLLERRADGTWLQISERRIASGGSVAVYSDLTEIKESEQRAAAANQLILQSLRYASRIQSAILPARQELASVTADHFLIWEPRDIVGGDFFWFQPIDDGYAIIVGDCTGHGVPGAFMTLIAWGMLDRMLARAQSSNPSQVLTGLHRGVQSLLGQDQDSGETDDGLEAGVCFINPSKQQITFAGARFSLWKARGDDVRSRSRATARGSATGATRRKPRSRISPFRWMPRTPSISPPMASSIRAAVRAAAPSASGASRPCSSATRGRRCRSRPSRCSGRSRSFRVSN